jgi:addiction module HigA family antidote
MRPEQRIPAHPGEVLRDEFLEPLAISQAELARHLGIPARRVNEIVRGTRGVSAETAWLFAKALETSPEFWLDLQRGFDLATHRPKRTIRSLRRLR